MADRQQFPEGIKFFPEHPSNEKTRQIQTTPSPLLEGDAGRLPGKPERNAVPRKGDTVAVQRQVQRRE